MNERAVVWLAAALLLLLAPLALLFGVEAWRVAIVTLFELIMVFWAARWRQRH